MSMQKTVLEIKIYGEPILRKKAAKLERITEQDMQILDEMAQLMYKSGGIGLAATQVGINKQLMVIDVGSGLLKLANPCIIKREGCEIMEEGCLSLPDVIVKVKRAKKITVEALDLESKKVTIAAQDLLCRAFQHEVDHLQGKLIIDYVPWLKKWQFKKKLKGLKKKDAK